MFKHNVTKNMLYAKFNLKEKMLTQWISTLQQLHQINSKILNYFWVQLLIKMYKKKKYSSPNFGGEKALKLSYEASLYILEQTMIVIYKW